MFNNNKPKKNRYVIESQKIDRELRISHLSDLHQKSFGEQNSELFRLIAEFEPDIIAVTGDMIKHERQKDADAPYLLNFARGIAQIAPSFFVTGNHEQHFLNQVTDLFEQNGVRVLGNAVEQLKIHEQMIAIGGVHDPKIAPSGLEQVAEQCGKMPGFHLLLAHHPEHFEIFAQHDIDLVLSGHTHAGQFRIPVVSAVVIPGQGLFPKYVEGRHEGNQTVMIISRGLGSSGFPPIRVNNPPDLVEILVKPV